LLLRVESLKKVYPNKTALDALSFAMEKGEIVGIIGESGAGKSTLLRILRGAESFDGGTIRLNGLEIRPDSPKEEFLELQKVTAIQLQRSFGLWPDSAVDNVIRAIRFSERGEETLPESSEGEYYEYRERALKFLKAVGLEGRADLWSAILSGGEKQRLIVARQIARGPELLILDEPGTMTCPATRSELIDALKGARRELGLSIIYASHNPQIHRDLADRMLLIEDGRIVHEGRTEDVLGRFLSGLEKPLPKQMISGPDVIKMENVSKSYDLLQYGRVFELAGSTLRFRRGEITGIVGPSGAGKTVILRMLAGLELPDRGEVSILSGGRWVGLGKLGRASMRARRRIGILHQEFDLPHWARILDLFGARYGIKDPKLMEESIRRAKEAGVDEATLDALYRLSELPHEEMEAKLREAGIDRSVLSDLIRPKDPSSVSATAVSLMDAMGLDASLLEKRVYELSGGEKIRVALALALVARPSVLILDEPFGDLDPLTLRRVANALKRVKSIVRPSIILVSHQLDFVEEIADRCILIRSGKVVMDGDPSGIVREFMEVACGEQ